MKNSVKFYGNKNKLCLAYVFGAVFFALSAVFGVAVGSTNIGISEIFKSIAHINSDTTVSNIILYIRLPRTLGCLVCGAALAVSGAVIQRVLANRLASPSIIGVNSGAGLGVTVCTALGVYSGWSFSLFAFFGALTVVLLISVGAKKFGASRGTVILMGVAANSFFNAVSDTIITLDPDIGIMSNDFKIGDFSSVTYEKLIPASIIVGVSLLVLFTLTNQLDIFALGEENAMGLGLNTKIMAPLFLLLSALLAGCAVSIAGLLSFVGLLVPHALKPISGSKISNLLPLCVLYGGGFVTLCDNLARTLFSPYEIPVGIIMSFLGVPFFIAMLIKRGQRT